MAENLQDVAILKSKNILISLSDPLGVDIRDQFFGVVEEADSVEAIDLSKIAGKRVYLCGTLIGINKICLDKAEKIFIISELSSGFSEYDGNHAVISLGKVPTNVYGLGVLYRQYFPFDVDYFDKISTEHEFQALTESNKPSKAHRKGIYLTPVEKSADGFEFHLLRCSTKLSGPTENFGSTDRIVVNALNNEAKFIFENQYNLNHVLAQIYINKSATSDKKQSKAKINSHADKTKDMPSNGVMAFVTFYDGLDTLKKLPGDEYDYGYKNTSALTTLQFKLKDKEKATKDLPQEFSVTLYPNSVFFMPLSTNRYYTHAIKPSILDVDRLPTRLGYVVRCSSTEAVFKDGATYLRKDNALIGLENPTEEGMSELRKLYAMENKTDSFVDYAGKFLFSMNDGDYFLPKYSAEDEFQIHSLDFKETVFHSLYDSVKFEELGVGRLGAVLSKPSDQGIPLVRTTSEYQFAVQELGHLPGLIAEKIQESLHIPSEFNNALMELYTKDYKKMGFHSDQALDLEAGSCIALFSCYRNPEEKCSRKLVVESKIDDQVTFEFVLENNSVILFSTDTNKRFRHKIVPVSNGQIIDNDWIGVTLRTSKTHIKYTKNGAFMDGDMPLRLASDEERKVFFQCRGKENREVDFVYPDLDFTISQSDLVVPEFAEKHVDFSDEPPIAGGSM